MRSKVLITFDSLRYDVFRAASLPFLKALGHWKRALTPASYTFPAHMSFFMGKLPQTLDDTDYYDSVTMRFDQPGRARRNLDLWRLVNPEAPREAQTTVEGRNLIDAFANAGLRTIGTGAVSWFNPSTPPGEYLTEPFQSYFHHAGTAQDPHANHRAAEKQVAWIGETLAEAKGAPAFVFANFGETHARFEYEGCPWQGERNPYGDRDLCLERQRLCLEHLDGVVRDLVRLVHDSAGPADLVLMGDHGEALGEDGLWGHGFSHPAVMEVPMLIKLAEDA